MTLYQTTKKVLVVLWVLSFCSLIVINMGLLQRNKVLAAQAAQKFAEIQVPQGTIVPALRGTDPHGNSVVVDPRGGRRTLITVFTTTCPYCAKNWSNWESIMNHIDNRNMNMVLVSLSGGVDESYLHAHSADRFTTISSIDPSILDPYRLRVVPQTILVGPDARVERVWTGVLKPKDVEYILQAGLKKPVPMSQTADSPSGL